ncbi:MAG: phage holin family protein [Acetanaerobacterium sp.]
MSDYTVFIKPELLILIPVLYFIGVGLKKSEQVKDKYIPISLGGAGIMLAILWVVATTAIAGFQDVLMAVFVGLTQGVLCAAGSVYFDQTAMKQPKKEE